MSNLQKCQESLFIKAQKNGYLTFDDILDASDSFGLSISDVDHLNEAINLRGIIVYEAIPQTSGRSENDDEVLDYSRTDYETIFKEIYKLAPNLKHLLDEIKNYPPPQYGEIDLLSMQIAEGNEFARERLITIYMRSVLKIALSMTKQNELDIEDAISSGFEGLISAVDKFDPSGFSAFHSYASLWIQQRIQRYCNPVWVDFYYPAHFKEKMYRVWQRYEKALVDDSNNDKEFQEIVLCISNELNFSEKDTEKYITAAYTQKYGKISIERITMDEDSQNLPSILIYTNFQDDMLDSIYQEYRKGVIEKAILSLGARYAKIVKMRFGFVCDPPMSLEEIGNKFGITRSRIQQIESKAKSDLKVEMGRYIL